MENFIKVFDLDSDSDANIYLEVWRSGASRRPHDHPEYLQLMRTESQHPYALVYYENLVAKIIYAYYIIEIDTIISKNSNELSKKHLVSAYGYGGPVLLNIVDVNFSSFEALLDSYLLSINAISEFVREDLFNDYKVSRRFLGTKQQDNVVIDLNKPHDELWKSYKYSIRKNISRAKSSNLRIQFDFDGGLIDEFVKIYHATMLRSNAKKSFFISYESFSKFNNALIEDGIGFYVHVFYEEIIIATELLLKSPTHIYSFLGGSDMNYSNYRPSDFLKHEVNTYAIDNNFVGYVLGGGVKPYDGIYAFKLAFDQNGARPFFIQRIIHNSEVYLNLISERREVERQNGNDWNPRDDFFPAYFS